MLDNLFIYMYIYIVYLYKYVYRIEPRMAELGAVYTCAGLCVCRSFISVCTRLEGRMAWCVQRELLLKRLVLSTHYADCA